MRNISRAERIHCGMPTLSVVLIVKNEQSNLCRLLPTLGFADEVVVCDTGSADDSVAVARGYGAKVCRFKWRDDFAAARNYALSHATCQYVMWLDADDFLPIRTRNFLTKWKQTPAENCADTYFMRYVCRADNSFRYWRERLLRNCSQCRFKGFIHEAIVPFGQTQTLDVDVVHFGGNDHSARNLRIYLAAKEQGRRFYVRDNYYFARTLVDNGRTDDALPLFRRCAANKRLSVAERADCLLFVARHYLSVNDTAGAARTLARVLRIAPPDPRVCCAMGDIAFASKDYNCAVQWYKLATHAEFCGGFVDAMYKTFIPYMQLAVCLWYAGDKQQAKLYYLQAAAIQPTHPTVTANKKYFA